MMKPLLIACFCFSINFSFSQLNYLAMKDTICPTLCGDVDSSMVMEMYHKLLNLDTTKISSEIARYYEDLSRTQYVLCMINNEDSTYLRLSLENTLKSLYHDPKDISMLWSAAFCYVDLKECDKAHYYLRKYGEVCPKRYWKENKDQIAILLMFCPNAELKKKFHIK